MSDIGVECRPEVANRQRRSRVAESCTLHTDDKNARIRNQWYGAFMLLNLLDVFLTLYIFHLGGHEANPIGALILDRAGWPFFVSFKLAQCAGVLLIIEWLYQKRANIGMMLIGFACSAYILLMFWDAAQLLAAPLRGH